MAEMNGIQKDALINWYYTVSTFDGKQLLAEPLSFLVLQTGAS
jgi:hypothetical protein